METSLRNAAGLRGDRQKRAMSFRPFFCVEHIYFVVSAASNFLTRCDPCVDEIAEGRQIRLQLRKLVALVFIIIEAWRGMTRS